MVDRKKLKKILSCLSDEELTDFNNVSVYAKKSASKNIKELEGREKVRMRNIRDNAACFSDSIMDIQLKRFKNIIKPIEV